MTSLQFDLNDPFIQRVMREEAASRAAGGRYKDEPTQFHKGPRPKLEVRGEGEGRHPMMMSEIAAMWDGEMEEDEFVEKAMEINEKYCSPPKPESKIRSQVQWAMRKEPCSAGPKVNVGPRLTAPAVSCSGFEYVVGPDPNLPPDDDNFEGWFPLGEVSLVFGSSGAGKTTWSIQMLRTQESGKKFFGRQTSGMPWVMVMKDRSNNGMRRTFRRMRLNPADLPLRQLPEGGDLPARIEKLYLAESVKPRIVFLEGLDLFVAKAKDADAWVPLLEGLVKIALHYNLAIVCTVGSPKQKPKERYEAPRDSAFGSQAVARMVETMVHVQENFDSGDRIVTAMPRNAPQSRMGLAIRKGVLVEVGIPLSPAQAKALEDLNRKAAFRQWWVEGATLDQARGTFGSEFPESTFYKWAKELRAKDSTENSWSDSTADPVESGFVDG